MLWMGLFVRKDVGEAVADQAAKFDLWDAHALASIRLELLNGARVTLRQAPLVREDVSSHRGRGRIGQAS